MRVEWLGDAGLEQASVGAKAANLSRLAASFRVPPGFCLAAKVHDALGGALDGDERAVHALRELVATAYRELARRTGDREPRVAVRSSAIGEDAADASFAGQHDTFLNVVGALAVTDAVLACWRSASSERAVAYRRERGLDGAPRVAVLVQRMVAAEASAIAFSIDPVSGERENVVVNATPGLGERLAAGEVTPDSYVVRRPGLTIAERRLAGATPAIDDATV